MAIQLQSQKHDYYVEQWTCYKATIEEQDFVQQSSRDCKCNSGNIKKCESIKRMLMIFGYLNSSQVIHEISVYFMLHTPLLFEMSYFP